MADVKKIRGSHDVDVDDYNPKPVSKDDMDALMRSAPSYVRKRIADAERDRKRPGRGEAAD